MELVNNSYVTGRPNSANFSYGVLSPSYAQLCKIGMVVKRRKAVLGRFVPIKTQRKCNILFFLHSSTKYLHKDRYLQIWKTGLEKSSTLNSIQAIQSLGKLLRKYCLCYRFAQTKPPEWDCVAVTGSNSMGGQ